MVHLDIAQKAAALHLGPLLSDAERRYLTCDATCEIWFDRDGEPRRGPHDPPINRRLRRALEHRHRTARCPAASPPAGCTPTTCGTGKTAAPPSWPTWYCCAPTTTGCTTAALITITGPADRLVVTDNTGRPLTRDRWPAHPHTPTRRPALPRTHRRARPMAVV